MSNNLQLAEDAASRKQQLCLIQGLQSSAVQGYGLGLRSSPTAALLSIVNAKLKIQKIQKIYYYSILFLNIRPTGVCHSISANSI
jgi:hypothetical protein